MIVHWEVEDGYCGGARPQETHIDDEDLEEMGEGERQQHINDCVQEDFEQKIGWAIIRVEE